MQTAIEALELDETKNVQYVINKQDLTDAVEIDSASINSFLGATDNTLYIEGSFVPKGGEGVFFEIANHL